MFFKSKKLNKIKKDDTFHKDVQDEINKKDKAIYDVEDSEYLKKKLMKIEVEDDKVLDLKKNETLNKISKVLSKRYFARNFMLAFVLFVGLFIFFVLTSIRSVDYTSFQYQENMTLSLGTLNLKYVTYNEEKESLNLDFKANIKATESSTAKRPYIIIKSFDRHDNQTILYEDWYDPYSKEDLNIDLINKDYKSMEGIILEIYEIRDVKELDSELTKYIEGAVVFKQDFRIYENIKDFLEEDKNRSEIKKEDEYVAKILYSNNNLNRFSEDTIDKINSIYSKRIKRIHKVLESYINKAIDILSKEKEVLVDLGITDEEWKVWLNEQKDNEFINFIDELEKLKSEYANSDVESTN